MNQRESAVAVVIGAGIGGLCIATLLVKSGISVTIFDKSVKVGGRTSSIMFRNHILDNGFHIMPFYRKSAIYTVLRKVGIENRLKLSKVKNIEFYSNDNKNGNGSSSNNFSKYPTGISDIIFGLSIIPFRSRINLLKILLPLAFTSIKKTERWDTISLTHAIKDLDENTKSFFDAICMLAFADVPEHISLGEFARTIIRANPFRGGTSEFGYPQDGGYDIIAKILAQYIEQTGQNNDNNNNDDITTMSTRNKILLNCAIKKVIVEDGAVKGVVKFDGRFIESNCVIVSYPAYFAINELFEKGVFGEEFVSRVNRLNKTTSVIEVHFALSQRIEEQRQVVFPVGGEFTAKGIFFISNITESVSPRGEHLVLAGTPVSHEDATKSDKIARISELMKKDLEKIYPHFRQSLIWERPMAWQLVESVVKEPGLVWKQKMPHDVPYVKGLFFVGDSTISYGIGTDSAAHSAVLCYPKIISYLNTFDTDMVAHPKSDQNGVY
ncbi:MAG: FAD-dependent oxidoreductase [Nitrososphaeraceae archaeon]|nr:FAD-dependent oxidoreductase [Nitrososphaeraceae archaeon]